MMAGPGDELATVAGGRGHLRASHADREQVIENLKAAFVQGRLTKDELDLRAGQALASRTYAELAALAADIPAGLTTAKPSAPAPGRGRAASSAAGPRDHGGDGAVRGRVGVCDLLSQGGRWPRETSADPRRRARLLDHFGHLRGADGRLAA